MPRYSPVWKRVTKQVLRLIDPAIFFPTGGWLDLPELCQTLLKHKNITVIENTGTPTLKPSSGQSWLLVDSEQRVIARESQVVLATAYDTDKQVDLTGCRCNRSEVKHH